MVTVDVGQVVTAAASVVIAYFTYRTHVRLTAVKREVKDVHTAVNSTAQDQNARTDQLTASLTDAGIAVPKRLPSFYGTQAKTETPAGWH